MRKPRVPRRNRAMLGRSRVQRRQARANAAHSDREKAELRIRLREQLNTMLRRARAHAG